MKVTSGIFQIIIRVSSLLKISKITSKVNKKLVKTSLHQVANNCIEAKRSDKVT